MSLDGLSLEAQQVIDNYLLRLSNHLHEALLEVRDSLVSSVEAQIQEQLQGNFTNLEQVKSVLNRLGDPEIHAASVTNWIWLIYLQQEANEALKIRQHLQS